MSTREELEIALEIITEGDRANISDELRRRMFGDDWARKMRAIQDRAEEWIGTRQVQGLAVGKRTTAGRRTDEFAIVVFVDRKRPRDKVRRPVPRRLDIPGIGSVETDVLAIGRLQPHTFTDRVRPAMPGCSIGHGEMETQGTFGLLVREQGVQGSKVFILSNAHVLALDGLAAVGDDIIQPGPSDVDGANGTIAKLADWVPFDFARRGWPNRVDAAIARVIRTGSVTNSIRDLDIVPVGTSFQIDEGMRVRKVGRSSDLTEGHVTFPSGRVKLEYMKTKTTSGFVRFGDQVVCTRYGVPGDSGSAILNDHDEVVGLHAAGSISACTFNKIEHVFSKLNLTLA